MPDTGGRQGGKVYPCPRGPSPSVCPFPCRVLCSEHLEFSGCRIACQVTRMVATSSVPETLALLRVPRVGEAWAEEAHRAPGPSQQPISLKETLSSPWMQDIHIFPVSFCLTFPWGFFLFSFYLSSSLCPQFFPLSSHPHVTSLAS